MYQRLNQVMARTDPVTVDHHFDQPMPSQQLDDLLQVILELGGKFAGNSDQIGYEKLTAKSAFTPLPLAGNGWNGECSVEPHNPPRSVGTQQRCFRLSGLPSSHHPHRPALLESHRCQAG